MNKKLFTFVTIALIFTSQMGNTEEVPKLKPRTVIPADPNAAPAPQEVPLLKTRIKLSPGRNSRSLASVDEPSAVVSEAKVTGSDPIQAEKQTQFRISAQAGISNLNSGIASTQTALTQGNSGQNLSVGLSGDFKYGWFGVEGDGYYGTALSQSTSYANIQQYGGMINAKVQTKVNLGRMQFIPKFGLGFGGSGLVDSITTSSSNTAVGNQPGNYLAIGPYAVAGFEVEPLTSVLVQIDYAHSFLASGSMVSSGIWFYGTGASFDRLRVGAYYKIFRPVYLGAQFIERSLNITFSNSNATNQQNSQTQLLGVLMYEL